MHDTNYTIPDPIIEILSDRLDGEPCFAGRRVPVRALFDYLKAGHPLEEFLDDYPSVSRHHAIAVIEQASASLLAAE